MSGSVETSIDRLAPFHAGDAEALTDYRTLSVLALVSLIVGLASPLAFAAPLAQTIPLIGIGLALVALRRIAVSGGALAGRWAALVGLAVSVASLLAVVSYAQTVRHLHTRQAEEFGLSWLTILQEGDTQRAFRLTSQGARKEPPIEVPDAPPPPNPYDEFLTNPVVQRLTQSAAASIHLERTYMYETLGRGGCLVGQRFEVAPPGPATDSRKAASRLPFQVNIRVQKGRYPGEAAPRWLVVEYQLVGDADLEADHVDRAL